MSSSVNASVFASRIQLLYVTSLGSSPYGNHHRCDQSQKVARDFESFIKGQRPQVVFYNVLILLLIIIIETAS